MCFGQFRSNATIRMTMPPFRPAPIGAIQKIDDIRVLGNPDMPPELQTRPARVVDGDERRPVVMAQVAHADVLPVALMVGVTDSPLVTCRTPGAPPRDRTQGQPVSEAVGGAWRERGVKTMSALAFGMTRLFRNTGVSGI